MLSLAVRKASMKLLNGADPSSWVTRSVAEIDAAWHVLLPLDARLRLEVRLQGGCPEDPLMDCQLSVDTVAFQLREQHLLQIVSLLIEVGQVLEPVVERDEDGAAAAGGKCGLLVVRERYEGVVKIDTHELGLCWVFLGPGKLWYETERGGVLKRQALRLDQCRLFQEKAHDFVLEHKHQKLGVGCTRRVLLQATSRSEANQWMSACAAMMQSPLVYEPTTQSQVFSGDSQQLHLTLAASLPEISIAIMPRKAPPGHSALPALLSLTLSQFSTDFALRAHDAHATILVGTVGGTASAGYPPRSMPLLLGSMAEPGSKAIELTAVVVGPLSPDYEMASAQLNLHGALQPVQLHCVPSVVHRIVSNVLRLCRKDSNQTHAEALDQTHLRPLAPCTRAPPSCALLPCVRQGVPVAREGGCPAGGD